MSVQIYKTGIVSASGDAINANLVRPQIGDSKWILWGSNVGTREKIEIDGKIWAHIVHGESTAYGGYTCDPSSNEIVIDPTKRYIWSCVAKAGNATNAEIIFWYHYRSTEGGANLSQNFSRINLTSKPTQISYLLPQYTHATYTVNRINLMMGSYKSYNEIFFTDIKVEEGTTSSVWIPHSAESTPVCNVHGFVETTQIPTQFYEDRIDTIDFIEY